MPTNDSKNPNGEYTPPASDTLANYPRSDSESAAAGYEMTDANVTNVTVFLGGLFGFVIIFFFFCFFMGRLINNEIARQDGPTDQFHTQNNIFYGAKANGGKREDLKSNALTEQQQFSKMKDAFPGPRLQTDDGNQDTADLHAREDLLLTHYSSTPGQPLRIPIDRAMQLIAQQGLPVSQAAQPAEKLAYEAQPAVTAPLTSGFARTGYELDQIEARAQKMSMPRPEGAEHAELKPVK
jgi:hypothetical protein